MSESSCRSRRWKGDFDARPAGDVRRALDTTALRFYDRTGHMQAYPSLSSIVHKMRTPPTLGQLRLHSCAAVTDANGHACRVGVGADDEASLFRHGLQCIHQDIQ